MTWGMSPGRRDKLLTKMKAAREFLEIYGCRPTFNDEMAAVITFPYVTTVGNYSYRFPVIYCPFYYNGKKVKINNFL